MIAHHPTRLPQSLFGVLVWSVKFYAKYAASIIGLGLLSSVGRAMQLGWSEYLSGMQHLLLEIVVEAARLAIFLVVVGEGSFTAGVMRIKSVCNMTNHVSIWNNLKGRWVAVIWSIAAFIIFACLVNVVIDRIANNDAVFSTVRNLGFPPTKDASLRFAIIFFLKNITIIPFTLVWLFGLYRMLR